MIPALPVDSILFSIKSVLGQENMFASLSQYRGGWRSNSGNQGTREAGEPEGRWRGALSRAGGGLKSMGPGGSHLGSTPYQLGDSQSLSFLVCKMGE